MHVCVNTCMHARVHAAVLQEKLTESAPLLKYETVSVIDVELSAHKRIADGLKTFWLEHPLHELSSQSPTVYPSHDMADDTQASISAQSCGIG